jgi:hypothetical protein
LKSTPEIAAIQNIQAAFMQFDRRAEKVSQEILARTFVDAEPLFIQLSSRNHQVFYGRRGTGKTHALKFLAESISSQADKAIYIDLRSVGSNGSIYSDGQRSIAERASRLIVDVLEAVEQELMQIAIEQIDTAPDPAQITLRLDDLGAAIRSVEVRGGSTEAEQTVTDGKDYGISASAKIGSSSSSGLELSATNKETQTHSTRIKRSGNPSISIDFGPLQGALTGLIQVLGSPTIWLLIDEWSEIPIDLQPYLADLVRRTVLPQPKMIAKIAAIEHRSKFAELGLGGSYIGIEIGADVTADINLDDFVVYDVDQRRATEFFKNLIFKHYVVSEKADPALDTADKLISATFTQITAFQEFVRAIEGVPRDALNLAAAMARIAFGRQIAVTDVRKSLTPFANATYSRSLLNVPLNFEPFIILNRVGRSVFSICPSAAPASVMAHSHSPSRAHIEAINICLRADAFFVAIRHGPISSSIFFLNSSSSIDRSPRGSRAIYTLISYSMLWSFCLFVRGDVSASEMGATSIIFRPEDLWLEEVGKATRAKVLARRIVLRPTHRRKHRDLPGGRECVRIVVLLVAFTIGLSHKIPCA